jgi:hypothetical protein
MHDELELSTVEPGTNVGSNGIYTVLSLFTKLLIVVANIFKFKSLVCVD